MAKLEGVKTLDMVNGEITKVAYGGAEYVKTDSPVQEGDIFLLTEGHLVIGGDTGAFYMANKRPGGGIEIPTIYRGNASAVQKNGNGIAFRKVAASTNPSVEERVAKAEGEIESLKFDVATLKGEAEYKRISKSEARAGDYVKFDDPPSYQTDKEYYEIKEFDDGDPVIIDDDNDEYDTYSDNFEVYRKVSASSVEAEPKPERLKVGDYAKVVQEPHRQNGEIVRLRANELAWPDAFPFRSERLDGTTGDIFGHKNLVRATDEEVAEAKRAVELAKFKEGAKVRLKSGGGEFPLNGYENGKVYEISYAHLQRNRIGIIGGEITMGFATPDQLEILSEEEASEYKKWAGIGREVGSLKKGDLVRVDNSCGAPLELCELVEVVSDSTEERARVIGQHVDGVWSVYAKLVTPVEARFDR
ncbi:hypothetical protein ACQXR1_11495 [Bacillus sp. ATD]|uniref:hypothetical protein n=1 Tax=Bacillus sp. ATD TaxID=3422305 RepID=UPI003D358ACC